MSTEKTINRTDLGSPAVQATDLHFFLYDRPIHPELFRHYADYRITQGCYQADVWILGLSHAVSVTSGHRSLTELLARDSEVLPARGMLSRFRLKGERDQERRPPDGWCHMVSSQVEIMAEPLYKSVHNDLLRHASQRGWFCPYEQWAEGELIPFSFIDYEARDAEFHLHAFHAFPQERTLIKTQSIFEISS
ncbi:MAG: DUF2617 family protein [Planctomycetota bacterium]